MTTPDLPQAPPGPTRSHPIRPLIILAVIIALAAENFISPVLRTTSPSLDVAMIVVVLLLPWVMLALAFRLRTRTQRFTVAALCGVFALLCTPVALLEAFTVKSLREAHDRNDGFKPVSMVQFGASRVIAYETNGGATTDFGFVVRQERPIGLGLMLVRDLYEEYHAQGGVVERVNEHTVRVYAESKSNPRGAFPVRRFVWF